MKRYHPESWSEQARKMANNQFYNYCFAKKRNSRFRHTEFDLIGDEVVMKTLWSNTVEYYNYFFRTSYRPQIVRYRAAKRFGRLVRGENRRLYLLTMSVIPPKSH